jgi:hypothetical protein
MIRTVEDLVGKSCRVTAHYEWCGRDVHGEVGLIRDVDHVTGGVLLTVDLIAGFYRDASMAVGARVFLWLDEVDAKIELDRRPR